MKRTIKYLPIDEIQPDPRNPRAHESIEDVKASILRFGFVDPIVHDGRTGRIVAGHGRQEALTALRDQWRKTPKRQRKVPDGIVIEGDQWLAPVVFGLETADDDEAAGLLMALNRLTETGKWLPDKQLALLDEIIQSVRGLEGVGFTQDDRDALQRLVEATGEAVDVVAEWAAAGMPDYESSDLTGAYRTTVHFVTMEDAEKFFKMLGRDRVSRFWWPESDGHRGLTTQHQWINDEQAQGEVVGG